MLAYWFGSQWVKRTLSSCWETLVPIICALSKVIKGIKMDIHGGELTWFVQLSISHYISCKLSLSRPTDAAQDRPVPSSSNFAKLVPRMKFSDRVMAPTFLAASTREGFSTNSESTGSDSRNV